ncbi:MAG: hypothetical protein IPH97_11235 [Ignavibacteriales bacterium]|nr:hypothetical protein [Ignavibacteriales bacterium]
MKVIYPKAAKRLLKIAYKNDFTLYEFFLSDHLGHGRIADEFDSIYKNLDEFLFSVLTEMDKDKLSLIICSDHGNLEDLSVKSHTENPALTISAGLYAKEFSEEIKDLTNIKSTIIKYCA